MQPEICQRIYSVLLLDHTRLSPTETSCRSFTRPRRVTSATPRPPPEGCPAFSPVNLCIQNQKTRALQVSCHIPVFPQALMENGGMEWGEIYGTNPSRVLKTLASAAATSSSFSPLPCSPLLLQPEPRERETGQPIRCVSQSRASHPIWPKCSARSLETIRTWTPVTPCGGFWLRLVTARFD